MSDIYQSIQQDFPNRKYDAIVVGGGHNGLVCAAYLAKAGKKTLVLERRHVLGGAAVSEEIYPGFTYSVCSYVVSMFRSRIVRELNLTKHGYQIIPLEGQFNAFPDGDSLTFTADPHENRMELARFSRMDAENYPDYAITMTKIAQFIKHIIDNPAPDPVSLKPAELKNMLSLALRYKSLGADIRHQHNKLLTMSADEFLGQWFESDQVRASLGVSGIIGTFLGPRSPGTAYVLLHHVMGDIDGAFGAWGLQKGGTGGVSLAIAGAAREFGADIRTEAVVAKIRTSGGKADGVVLEDGREIAADIVVSGCDPHQTFIKMVGESELDSEFIREIRNFKYRGSSGKVNLALDRLPEFACKPGAGPHLRGDINVGHTIDLMEQAYDDAKYGRFSRHPILNIVIPSLADPSVAPPGKHIISIFVQYAPYHLAEGAEDWPNQREAFGDAVVDLLAEYIPGLKESILHRQVVTPWDLEERIGMTEGNIFQGELTLEQLLFQRPAPGWAQYNTPIRDLWLCGSAAHPGGGIMGAPGELAAKKIIKTRGR